jgi:hypothetical protein
MHPLKNLKTTSASHQRIEDRFYDDDDDEEEESNGWAWTWEDGSS